MTLAMPKPPTVRASRPAKRATSWSVRFAWAAAWRTLLGTWVDTWSEPPRLIAVGMALAVACVVPGSGAHVELVGLTVRVKDVLGRPLSDEHGVVEIRVEGNRAKDADHAEVRAVQFDRADLTGEIAVLLGDPVAQDDRADVKLLVGAVEPTSVDDGDLEHRRQVEVGGPYRHGERLVVGRGPLDGQGDEAEMLVVAAALDTVEMASTRWTALLGKEGFCDPKVPPAWAMMRLVPSVANSAWSDPLALSVRPTAHTMAATPITGPTMMRRVRTRRAVNPVHATLKRSRSWLTALRHPG